MLEGWERLGGWERSWLVNSHLHYDGHVIQILSLD